MVYATWNDGFKNDARCDGARGVTVTCDAGQADAAQLRSVQGMGTGGDDGAPLENGRVGVSLSL